MFVPTLHFEAGLHGSLHSREHGGAILISSDGISHLASPSHVHTEFSIGNRRAQVQVLYCKCFPVSLSCILLPTY